MVRYEQIITLRKQGMKNADIATQVGMAERTVRQWLTSGSIPHSRARRERARLIDPYKTYLLERWNQGCHNGLQLEKELKAQGYQGSQRGMYRYLATLEPSAFPPVKRGSASPNTQTASSIPSNPLLTLSAQQATWLFFRRRADLKEEELKNLQLLRQASPRAETAYQLVETFLQMVRERRGYRLDAWLKDVEASHLKAFASFTTSIQQDKDAVVAGLTLPWSTGPLEGHVNRLKLIKRSMYGRAKFDLLRLRVLHRAKQASTIKAGRPQRTAQGKKLRKSSANLAA